MNRRSFLKTASGLAALPLVASALARKDLPTSALKDPVVIHTNPNLPVCGDGLAIKVPSNRVAYHTIPPGNTVHHYRYWGDWDGAFKLERGCTNPAYILADLYERTDEKPDWVVADKSVPASFAAMPMVMGGVREMIGPRINWQMLYDWGVYCDQRAENHATVITFEGTMAKAPYLPLLSVDASLHITGRESKLRERLRMFCLSWQSTDPRYRTSWPGIPYPKA